MPHGNRPSRPRASGTAALFAASATLAVIGTVLLVHRPAAEPDASRAHPAPPAVPGPAHAAPTAADDAPANSLSLHTEAGHSPASLPSDITTVARGFVLAWTGHDARPGQDASYTDAAERAAAYADRALASQLVLPTPGTARQWQQWTAAKARVAAAITRIAVPDGAPAPTDDTAWVRVRYRLTVAPAAGRATSSDEQVVLKLQRSTAGTWLVTALPYA